MLADASAGGKLGAALADSLRGIDSAPAALVALELTPHIDRRVARTALSAVCLLEGADRAEATVHGLAQGPPAAGPGGNGAGPGARRFTPSGGSAQGDTTMALAGAWLRSRAAELAAGLGAAPLRELAAAMSRMAEGWRREAQDLYDAGCTPERCLETAEQRGGSLFAVAACLDAIAEQNSERVEPLRRFGTALGTAAVVRDDIAALTAADARPHPLQRGAYSLPVAHALQAEPRLAGRIGGAVTDDAVAGLVREIAVAGGLERAGEDCTRLVNEAVDAIAGLDGCEGAIAVARAMAAPAMEAV